MGDVTEATAGDVTEAAAAPRVPSQCRDGLPTLHSREQLLMVRHYHVHWSCMIVGVAPSCSSGSTKLLNPLSAVATPKLESVHR
eukprot:COSAG02_NODE_776_length_17302_cov_17.765855_10_plen_84_part_00